jgi:hypothetical protein
MSTTAVRSVTQAGREYGCVVVWHGVEVAVEAMVRPCDPANCALTVMHHYGDDGTHYCPTGFLFCSWCCGVADEPGEPRCQHWGTRPE